MQEDTNPQGCEHAEHNIRICTEFANPICSNKENLSKHTTLQHYESKSKYNLHVSGHSATWGHLISALQAVLRTRCNRNCTTQCCSLRGPYAGRDQTHKGVNMQSTTFASAQILPTKFARIKKTCQNIQLFNIMNRSLGMTCMSLDIAPPGAISFRHSKRY